MEILVKLPTEETYRPYANNANIPTIPGLIDFQCQVKNSNPVVMIVWSSNVLSSISEHSSSYETDHGNGLFDYTSFSLDNDVGSCGVRVSCAATNEVIAGLGEESTWTRSVNIQFSK